MEAVAGLGGELMAKKLTDISSLVPDSKNANQGTERGRFLLEKSFRELGAGRSVVTDAEGRVIGGNKALEIAEELGLPIEVVQSQGDKLVVVQRTDLDLSDDHGKARQLAYLDNRAGEVSLSWNPAQIVADLDTGVDLEGMFRPEELSDILEAAADALMPGEPPEPQVDKAEELREQWQTERGQVWAIASETFGGKSHRVMCGDSTSEEDVARLMDGERPRLLVADPPYCSGGFQEAGRKSGSVGTRGTELVRNDQLSSRGYQALMGRVLQVAEPTVTYLFTDWRMWVVLFDVVESVGLGVRAMIVWDKQSPGMGRGWRHQHELIMCGARESQPFDPHKAQGDVIQCGRTGNVLHATEKPVELITTILGVTDMHKMAYDPFMGSGPTIVACEQKRRLGFGMELEPKYVAVTLQRLADMGLEPKLIDNA